MSIAADHREPADPSATGAPAKRRSVGHRARRHERHSGRLRCAWAAAFILHHVLQPFVSALAGL